MKYLKALIATMLALGFLSCSSGPGYDDCVKKATEVLKTKGVPEASLQMMAEQSCAACKENKKACKTIIDAL